MHVGTCPARLALYVPLRGEPGRYATPNDALRPRHQQNHNERQDNMVNKVEISGNAVEDAVEITSNKTGEVIGTRFRMAYSTGDNRTPSGFINVTTWEAIKTASPIVKGSKVQVAGSLSFDTWEKDGQNRQAVTLTATEVA